MLSGSFLLLSPSPLLSWFHYSRGTPRVVNPHINHLSLVGICQQDPTVAKIETVMTEGKDQVGKIKRKVHLITSPHFFNSVLINHPVHFSFIILILLFFFSTPAASILRPYFSIPCSCLVNIQDIESIIWGLDMGKRWVCPSIVDVDAFLEWNSNLLSDR